MTKFLQYLPSTICLLVAAVLAFYGRDGWGWFLFGALVFGGVL